MRKPLWMLCHVGTCANQSLLGTLVVPGHYSKCSNCAKQCEYWDVERASFMHHNGDQKNTTPQEACGFECSLGALGFLRPLDGVKLLLDSNAQVPASETLIGAGHGNRRNLVETFRSCNPSG